MKTLPVLATFLALSSAAVAQTTDCARLTALALLAAKITSAKQKENYCEVQGIASPAPASRIGFTVWLPPAARWSQRLHMAGNGGYSSKIYYAQLEARLQRGDVAVATDTGHTGGARSGERTR